MGRLKCCTKCGEEKELTEFRKNRGKPNARCKVCADVANKKYCQTSETYKGSRRISRRKWQLKRLYGLTQEAYDELLHAQGGVCAICQNSEISGCALAVDHNHLTGEVRGLLCKGCNAALGKFRDDPFVIARALQYILSARGGH